MLFVISIIGILTGILLPSLVKSRERAKSVRWLASNELWNRDSDTILNFNFEYVGYMVNYRGTVFPGLRNGAVGCGVTGFEPPLYDGVLVGGPELKKKCGRWGSNNALQFDGVNDFVLIPGTKALNFDPGKDDFTFILWFNLDNLNSSTKTFFSKADLPAGSQYDASLESKTISVGLGTSSTPAEYPDIKENKWINLAIRCSAGKTAIFMNGKQIGGSPQSAAAQQAFDTSTLAMIKIPFEIFSVAQSSNSNAGGQGGGQGGGTSTQSVSHANFVLGASGISGESDISGTTIKVQNTSYYFQGMLDEVIVIKRTLSDGEISGIYKMGNPY